jgi:hypothetical protein
MRYDPTRVHHERYVEGPDGLTDELRGRIHDDCLKLCTALGYDVNTIEFAIRDGVPYAIDFLNPAPDMDYYSVHADNFEWVVEHMADLVIRYALGDDTPVGEDTTPGTMHWQRMITAPHVAPAAP